MKKVLFVLCSVALCIRAYACGPYDRGYLARDYFMFRACGTDMCGTNMFFYQEDQNTYDRNCEAWASITTKSVPNDDIKAIVYTWSLSQIKSLYDVVKAKHIYSGDNKFASWIVDNQDTEVLDFLLLAKRNEKSRKATENPWYYAVEGDEVSSELYDIVEQSKLYKGKRLRDRYVLQLIRALFSLRQYDECLNVWNGNKQYFKNDVIKELITGYVAGAYYHLGNKKMASKMYLQNKDFLSAYRCAESKMEFVNWVYNVAPDSEIIIQFIQNKIHSVERQQYSWNYNSTEIFEYGKDDYEKIFPFIKRIIDDRRCENMAQWYYAAAFVASKLGNRHEATSYIGKAKSLHANLDLRNAIRVLDIYLKIKYADSYSQQFENYIFSELRWLDKLIVSNLSEYDKQRIMDNGLDNHVCGYSQYYWNDMMRKIVISELVPLCIKSNYKTRALQYLNMADNRILKLVPETHINRYYSYGDYDFSDDSTIMNIDAYRGSTEFYNCYDYRNDYFMNLDSLGVKYVKNLSIRMQHPLSPLDRFLNERSYDDPQFLYDIIGTQLIASMKYKDACKYLEKVSSKFNASRNIIAHCNIDPFTGKRLLKPDNLYKLHFAKKMYALEKDAKYAKNKNDKAEAMLMYAKGLQNSVGEQCWPLSSYYWGCYSCYPLYSMYQRHLISDVTAKARIIKNKAFNLFTDEERAAKAYYDWKMFKTLVAKYGNTTIGKNVKGKCDNLYDYKLEPELHPKMRWEEWEANNR